MVDFLQQNFVAADCSPQVAFIAFAFDRHPENICRSLKEGEIVLDEIIVGAAVDLQNAERLSVTLQDNIHRTAYTMVCQ